MKRNKTYQIYVYYAILFCGAAFFFWCLFKKAGSVFLWKPDGIYQHFSAFLYARRYIASLAGSIFGGQELSLPLMNYTLGQGADVITTLNSYDFLDPVSWLSIILFRNNSIFAYEMMIFLKLFLAGISFCVYCHVTGRTEGWKTASGALIYTFCGFGIYCCARHPNFMSGMYFLPLTYAAAELYIRKDRKLPLVLVTFFSILTSYYSFYMDTVCFAVYLLVRLFPSRREEWKENFFCLLKIIGISAVGVLLSAFTLLPTVEAFLNNARTGAISGYTDSFLIYPPEYYDGLKKYFIHSAVDAGYWTCLGFAPIVLVGILVLFTSRKKEWNRLRVLWIVCIVMLCIPFVGLAMNGFGYVSNRWNYAVALVTSIVYVETSEQLGKLSIRKQAVLVAVAIALGILCYGDPAYQNVNNVPLLLLALTVAVILLGNQPHFPAKFIPAVLTALVLVSVMGNITVLYGEDYGNYISEFEKKDTGYGFFRSYSLAGAANSAEDETFYRTEMKERRTNTEGYHNVFGTTFWYSIMSSDSAEYYSSLQMDTLQQNCNFQGLDGRTALMSLASVRYYTIPTEEEECYVPYGFTKTDEGVYENEYALSPAFLYDRYISKTEYQQLNPLERQQSMLQGAVLEDSTEAVKEIIPESRLNELEYTVKCENVALTGNKIQVQEKGGTITLYFNSSGNSELFLWIDGIALDENQSVSEIGAISGVLKNGEQEQALIKKARITTLKYKWPIPRDGVTFQLGYSEEGYHYCTIIFYDKYTFYHSGIHLYENPMEKYVEDITKLRNNACEDIKIADDRIYGTVSCDSSSLLQLSVPYSKGWTAYVDGKNVPVIKSNMMYMAIELTEGDHEIELKYCTPYLKAGLVISGLTALGMLIYGLCSLRWKKKGSQPSSEDKNDIEGKK